MRGPTLSGMINSAHSYTVRYEITVDSLVDMRRMALTTAYRLTVIAAIMIFIGAVVIIIASIAFELSDLLWVGIFLFGSPALIGLTISRPFQAFFLRRKAAPLLGVPHEVTFGDEGISYRSAGTSAVVNWAYLTRVRDDSRTILFMKGQVLAFWLPAYAFSEAAQRSEILAFARERIAAASAAPASPIRL